MAKDDLLGAILVDMGAMTEQQLDEAIQRYQATNYRHTLGKFLTDKSIITEDQLRVALLRQKVVRDQMKRRFGDDDRRLFQSGEDIVDTLSVRRVLSRLA